MDTLTQVLNLHKHDNFFEYYMLALCLNWFILSSIAIRLRGVSIFLYGFLFFLISASTFYFIGSFLHRLCPTFDTFSEWAPLKQGHVIGGVILLVLLIIHEVSGVYSFLTKRSNNTTLHKFTVVVTNLGRLIAISALILGEQKK